MEECAEEEANSCTDHIALQGKEFCCRMRSLPSKLKGDVNTSNHHTDKSDEMGPDIHNGHTVPVQHGGGREEDFTCAPFSHFVVGKW
eukprot:scaffold3058_cov165-Ochromonas_danica.AAC.16